MSCSINLVIILTVCFPHVYSQAVVSTQTNTPYWCLKTLTMKCTITGIPCCTNSPRIWKKNQDVILTSGAEVNTSNKYSETSVGTGYYTMTINNLEEKDLGTEYLCTYSVYTSLVLTPKKEDLLCPPCLECVKECFLKTACYGIPSGYCLEIIIFLVGFCCCCKSRCYKYLKVEPNVNRCSAMKELLCNKQILKTLGISSLVTVVGYFIIFSITTSISFGWHCYICYYSRSAYLIIFGLELLILNVIFYWTRKWQKGKCSWQRYIFYVIASFLIFPIWIPFLYHSKCPPNGGKNQSVESGSSCWPICRVGQDPNTSSSGPEKVRRSPKKERADKKPTDFARSQENERADKKKERKPTEVVRPQPTRPLPPMHLKTDNTGRAEYSTETEIFKPPALPSINKASDSPRPLPQKPPGTQLDPLRESTSEKKKKKKRKKKEPKQSDEEN